jgi:hypothetical protein
MALLYSSGVPTFFKTTCTASYSAGVICFLIDTSSLNTVEIMLPKVDGAAATDEIPVGGAPAVDRAKLSGAPAGRVTF